MAATKDAASSGLTDHYNEHSKGSFLGHAAKHLAFMGLFMAFPMVAAAMPLESATALDLVVQTGHAIWDMGAGLFEHGLPVLESVFENALEGNFGPGTLEAGSMHGMAGGVHMMPDGSLMANVSGTQIAASAATGGMQVFSTPMDWFTSLPQANQLSMIEDAQAFGVPFSEYIADWCANNHITFGQSLSPN